MTKKRQKTLKPKKTTTEQLAIMEAAKNMMGYLAMASESTGIMRLAEHILSLEVALARSGVSATQLNTAKTDVSKAVTTLFSTMVPAQHGYWLH